MAADGRLLAETSGEALPRDREHRPFDNLDVIELMFEQIFAKLP
jgi:hypothetical protein